MAKILTIHFGKPNEMKDAQLLRVIDLPSASANVGFQGFDIGVRAPGPNSSWPDTARLRIDWPDLLATDAGDLLVIDAQDSADGLDWATLTSHTVTATEAGTVPRGYHRFRLPGDVRRYVRCLLTGGAAVGAVDDLEAQMSIDCFSETR